MEKVLEETLKLYSSLFRELERLNMKVFNLSKFLLDKGIMNDKEFDFYCSEKSIDIMAKIVDERLKKEGEIKIDEKSNAGL